MIPRLEFDRIDLSAPSIDQTGRWIVAVFGLCVTMLMLATALWCVFALGFKVVDMFIERHIVPASYQEACHNES